MSRIPFNDRLRPASCASGAEETTSLRLQVSRKFQRRRHAEDHEAVAGTGAGDVKELAFGVVSLVEIGLVGDRLDPRRSRTKTPTSPGSAPATVAARMKRAIASTSPGRVRRAHDPRYRPVEDRNGGAAPLFPAIHVANHAAGQAAEAAGLGTAPDHHRQARLLWRDEAWGSIRDRALEGRDYCTQNFPVPLR